MRRTWFIGLLLVAAIVVVLAPLASSDPDGLERVAQDLGFADTAVEGGVGPMPDYQAPLLGDGTASLIVAGLIGVAVMFGSMWWLGRMLARRAHSRD